MVFHQFSGQGSGPILSCYCLHLIVSVHIGEPPGSQPGTYLSFASFPASVGGKMECELTTSAWHSMYEGLCISPGSQFPTPFSQEVYIQDVEGFSVSLMSPCFSITSTPTVRNKTPTIFHLSVHCTFPDYINSGFRIHSYYTSLVAQLVKNPPAIRET